MSKSAERIHINGILYDKEILKTDLVRPSLLTVDSNSNTLYFSFISKDDENYKSARLDLNTKQFNTIDDVVGGYAHAADQKTGDVYIGCDDGLYKYDPITNKTEFIGEKGGNILSIFYKDVLYYTKLGTLRFLHTFTNGEASRCLELQDLEVENFCIDNEDMMFFVNDNGIYGQKKGTYHATLYEGLPDDYAECLTADVNGVVHVCYRGKGIFKINKETACIEKVADLGKDFGATATFDKDNNIVYADATRVIRLVPTVDV
ncbi:ommochrome-binding protein-like [Galleria mellonella]|uniref:Ommochrome-binding protein-like n=1 Tax=Galleria mellonella TaxID=7137 RepID=A0A6J1WGZ1_GALME|nr:ommochrome-binding protein-like [Galleria mellonella]XP_026753393.2 ommochrome-binding protein-like [Galleria mellonella]XP_026753395.2 ommochrome-binding protein-like [Galleria mellonella]XP_052747963.1 ommochrome-binding protein-like [Galleria mellonella]